MTTMKQNTITSSLAYKGGVSACKSGMTKDDCPYQLRSLEAKQWLQGFILGCNGLDHPPIPKYHDQDHYFDV